MSHRRDIGHPPHVRQCIASNVRATAFTSRYGVMECTPALGGIARSRILLTAPAPCFSHHSLPRLSRSASNRAKTRTAPTSGTGTNFPSGIKSPSVFAGRVSGSYCPNGNSVSQALAEWQRQKRGIDYHFPTLVAARAHSLTKKPHAVSA